MRNLSQAARSNEFTFKLTSNALVALMMTCAAFTLLSLIERVAPDWQPTYLPVLCLAVALERLYTIRRFKNMSIFSKEWAIAMLSEWVVILLLIKLVSGLSHGAAAFLAEIPRWTQDFNHFFLTADFILALVLVVLTWLLSGSFARLLAEMDLAQAIQMELNPAIPDGRPPARERLMSLILSLGTALIMITGLVRVDLRTFLQNPAEFSFAALPALAGGGASTLLYFMLALALLSQTRFIDLHTRWSVQKIQVNHRLGQQWTAYSLAFLAIMAALVALLPTSYSLKTLTILGQGLELLTNLLFSIAQGIITVLIFIISLVFSLFGRTPGTIAPPPIQEKLPEIAAAAQAAAPPDWWNTAKTLAFWAIFLLILLFALTQYLRQHDEILLALRKMAAQTRLTRLWNWLGKLFTNVQKGISRSLQAARERLRAAVGASALPVGSYLSTRRLDPRQKITFFYLALIRRGGEKGLPRRPSQTPYEYASTLERALPEVEEDIDTLTQAFIEARYSPRPVETEQVNLVKNTWERLRKAFRKRLGAETADKKPGKASDA